MRKRPLCVSNYQQCCIIDATIAPLTSYRRGYARSNNGPFYPRRTIRSMLRNGSLRVLYENCLEGYPGYAVTALAKKEKE
jgi:hypothetical protein